MRRERNRARPREPRLAVVWRRVGQIVDKSLYAFFRDGCTQRAASISFYALFSLFPLAIICVAVLGLFANDAEVRHRVVTFILDKLPLKPDQGRAELQDLLLHVTRDVAGFSVLGIITLLFAATGIMAAVRLALNAAFGCRDDRPPAQAKLWDLLMVLIFGVMVTASFALTLADQIRSSLSRGASEVIPGLGGVVTDAFFSLGRVLPLLIAMVVFAGLFYIVPAKRQHPRDTWPGVLVAAFGYELAKTGFAIYLTSFANYGAVYASLGSIIAFLVFVYIAANIALLGAEVAAEWPAVRSGAYDGDDMGPLHTKLWNVLKSLFVRTD
jgi:membrane protein